MAPWAEIASLGSRALDPLRRSGMPAEGDDRLEATAHRGARAEQAEAEHVGLTKPRIVVLGALAIDIRMEVSALPTWHEAVQADSYSLVAGGKGMNQAVAASRLGADVAMIGAVGTDAFGEQLVSLLQSERVSAEFVKRVDGALSGMCGVFVNYQADVAFVGWKNDRELGLSRADIDVAAPVIEAADAMLVTLETPLAAVERAVDIAKRHDVKVIFNPAPPLDPPHRVSHVLLGKVDAVIPNVWEAGKLLGAQQHDGNEPISPQSMATRIGRMMRPDGVACVTTGSRGCVVFARGRLHEYPGFPSNPIDTTGGSDAFCAAYAMAVISGKSLDEAFTDANAAGSIVVGGVGGSASMPAAGDVGGFVRIRRRPNAGEP
jgi:ribokinase